MLFRKLLRTVGRYKAQFVSMIIMIALGTGMFLGFNIEWVSLDRDTSEFFEQTGFADYRLSSAEGFSAADARKIAEIDGVDAAARYLCVNADVESSDNMLALTVTENPRVSGFIVMGGEAYDETSVDGIWLSDHYAEKNNLKLGDTIKLSYESLRFEGTVKGFIESGEHMICVRDESQLMPDFKSFGYAYVSPEMLKKAVSDSFEEEYGSFGEIFGDVLGKETYKTIYPQINVLSKLDKAEFTEKVDEALSKTQLILTKDENVSYVESQGEVEEGKTMGAILPVLFMLIAVLTMVTTMHRLAANEKTQIGTLKALGFKDGRILRHYTSYATVIGILGTALGIALGYGVGRLIMDPGGMMGTYIVMPNWTLYMPWWCWAVIVLINVFLTLIGYLSTKSMLKGTAADALRPYSPKKMKRLAVERIKALDKLSFGTKWNLRDVLRHKSRSLMTLFGVLGCTILVTASFGMNDTMNEFMDTYYSKIANYTSQIYVSDNADNDDALKLAKKYNGDSSAAVSVQITDTPVSLEIYHIEHGLYSFIDDNSEQLALPDDGALVCARIRDDYKLKLGDEITVSPYGTSDEYTVRVAGFNRSMTEAISISDKYAQTLVSGNKPLTDSKVYKINSIYTNTEKRDISDGKISSVKSKQDIIESMQGFMEILYLAVALLIIAAVVLAIVVLYNLGVMSFTERYREMATLKVVGFKDKQIGRLLISQNIWLSVLGIAVGMPVGYVVLDVLMKMLASEYEMATVISPLSYLLTIALTLGVSLFVGWRIARKNRKIEMVSALKTGE